MNGKLTNLQTGATVELSLVSLIGRSTESSLLIEDPRVSRRHAIIRKQEDGYCFFDLGSFNGSHLNGSRVTTARQLSDGDVLNFADHEFKFADADSAKKEDSIEDQFGQSTIAFIRSRQVIILVSDIQGFSALSERLSPDDLAQVIGSWYSDCELILSRHGGTVDKFIGDCVLAYWTVVNEANFERAVQAARELLQSCDRINLERKEFLESAGKSFGSGVALHTGEVAYGGMSQGEFTLVGDPVNLTFRVEALTRELKRDLLATGRFVELFPKIKQHSENLGTHRVKGRDEPVEVWGIEASV